MIRQTLFKLSQQQQLRVLATHNPLARSMARRFVAGESLDEAIEVVRQIDAGGMTATFDHLGENVATHAEAIEATSSACELLHAVARAGIECNASLKLTQLGLDISDQLACDNLDRILTEVVAPGAFIRIDMESSEYVERTLDVFYRLFEHHKNVGVVIQSCLFRSAADVERLIQAGARVRLVKGAYLEPASVAFQRKADVDANFVRLAALLLSGGHYPAIATHDQAMIDAAILWASDHEIGSERYEFQMLYGVRRDLQSSLHDRGYNVRVYVPYGTSWYPYLMRRLAERPANVMFVLSNIAREAAAGRK